MMDELGIRHLDSVILAGALSSFINRKSAAAIDFFPDFELENVQAVGNAAGDGARMALLNAEKRKEAEHESAKVEYVKLTTRPGFQKEYPNHVFSPHDRSIPPQPGLRKLGTKMKVWILPLN